MRFRQDRWQDEKDMAFETFGVLDERIVGMTIFLQRSYTTPMALESSRLAELKYAISAAWDVKKSMAFDRAHLNKTFPRSKSVLP